jgi:protein-disulfide isomerase
MRVLLSLLLVIGSTLPCAAGRSTAGEKQTAAVHQAGQNGEVARIDGAAIYLHDLNYDPEKRNALELHAMQVRLYREQKAALQQYIDRRLLEKEAAQRNMTAEELITMINAQAGEKTKELEAEKETLFQEFIAKMQRDFPSFAHRTAAMTPPGPLLSANGNGSPFIEEIKNKVVAMKKASLLNETKEAFMRDLRAQSHIDMFLERPQLFRLDLAADDDDPWRGSKDAPITLLTYIDFQCPYCKQLNATLKDLLAKRKEGIRVVAKNFPLPSHPEAAMAAQAAACADDQGRYWDYHDLLFENRQELDAVSLRRYAAQAGLDTTRFDRCLESGSRRKAVEQDVAEAALAGINGTPAIVISGYWLPGSPSLTYLEEVIADIENGNAPRVEEAPGNE